MLPDTSLFPVSSVNETYSSLFDASVLQTFFAKTDSRSVYSAMLSTRISGTSFEVIRAVRDSISDDPPQSEYFDGRTGYITFGTGLKPELMVLMTTEDSKPFFRVKRLTSVTFYGSPERVESAFKAVSAKHKEDNRPEVMWYCLNNGRMDCFSVECAPAQKYTDEFYPWIKNGVNNYYDDYIKSDSNILLLYGDPGTGKTSFIRNLMWRHCLSTMISYDQDMFTQDSFFVNFLNSSHELLVIEDADVILLDREEERNPIVSKILNASDGLVKIPNKKIIFTANITNMSKIDSALLRPGRCFDVVEFRKLTANEAYAAADSVGIDIPENSNGYTLAELFNYMTPSADRAKKGQRIGFGR